MGPLTLIKNLPENFLVMNGDVLTDMDFNVLFETHSTNNNNFTIASYRRKEKIDFGVLRTNKDSKLTNFEEKPEYDFLVSMGVYIVNKSVISLIPRNTFFGFDHLMKLLINQEHFPTVYEFGGFWLDIGRPDDYEKAVEIFKPEIFF